MAKKTITIHQPDFIPWVGFFERWAQSDLYIVLDDVQFLRRGWHHRDKIRTRQGEKWLTVPVKKKGNYHQNIKDVQIETESDWRKKHLNLIFSSYSKAPCFNEIYFEIEKIYSKEHERLVDLNVELLFLLAGKLDINTPIMFSSKFNINSKGTNRLLELALETEADIYLTGSGAGSYLDEALFEKNGIQVKWHEFNADSYLELYKKFEPGLSIIDLLMNIPAKEISKFLKGVNKHEDIRYQS